MEVMCAVPGNEIVGLYRRTYDKMIIQRIIIDRGPKNYCTSYRSGVRPGTFGPVLSRVLPKSKNARFDFLKFSRRVDFSPLAVDRNSGVLNWP
jgi:hypothetical protein